MKWSRPHFLYKGMLCGMSAFKEHCAFGFWRGSLILGKPEEPEPGMGQFGKITQLSDLPVDEVLARYIREAMRLNDEGVKSPGRSKPKSSTPRPLVVPDDLAELLANHDQARATFEGFPPSQKREYIEWITEAKTQPTRSKRLATTIEWLAEGKIRHWKYQDC
jgi:uncharacterized protein YdeI (YjbR/CyaY-like superfamily)